LIGARGAEMVLSQFAPGPSYLPLLRRSTNEPELKIQILFATFLGYIRVLRYPIV